MNSRSVHFGLTLPQRGIFFGITTVPEMVELARQAERSGLFESVWVGDSLLAKARPDSLTLLGGLTTVTEQITLGVGCMASFVLRDPLVFSYQWATLDVMSGGRMLLAACTGIVAGGVSASEGRHWRVADRERAERLAENIEICRRLWSEDGVSFAGKYHSYQSVTLRPQPVQQPCPIWIASNPMATPGKPESVDSPLRRVARLADGWMTVQLFPQMFAVNWQKVRRFLEDEGRDPENFPNMLYHNININEDRAAALAESKRFLDEYYGPVFSPAMVEAWTAAGTAEQCMAHLRELITNGAKGITLRITSWQQQEQYDRLVQQVLPHLDAHA